MVNFFKLLSLTILLGLFMVPISLLACKKEIPTVKQHAKKDTLKVVAIFSELKNSCDDGTCTGNCCNKNLKGCGHEGCDGNCNMNSCFTASSSSVGSLPLSDFLNKRIKFSLSKNSRFFYKNSFYSFGFHSIWQPPKIG